MYMMSHMLNYKEQFNILLFFVNKYIVNINMQNMNKHLANQEWSKDIKFNGHWYHLQALFDQDQDTDTEYNYDDQYQDVSDINSSKFDFNKEVLGTTDQYDTADIDDMYDEENELLEWTYNNVLDIEKIKDPNKADLLRKIMKEIQTWYNGEHTKIVFDIHYYVPTEENKPYPTSRILINKNIIEHSIEDFIYNRLVRLSTTIPNMQVYRNLSDGQEDEIVQNANDTYGVFNKSKTYDIKIVYNGELYYFEIKSGERHKNSMQDIDIRNVRIHDNQYDNKDNMIFFVTDYVITNPSKNIVTLNNTVLIDGVDINRPSHQIN